MNCGSGSTIPFFTTCLQALCYRSWWCQQTRSCSGVELCPIAGWVLWTSSNPIWQAGAADRVLWASLPALSMEGPSGSCVKSIALHCYISYCEKQISTFTQLSVVYGYGDRVWNTLMSDELHAPSVHSWFYLCRMCIAGISAFYFIQISPLYYRRRWTCCFAFRHNTCSFPFLLLNFEAILLLQESWLIGTPCQYSITEESVLGQLSGGLNAVSCLDVLSFIISQLSINLSTKRNKFRTKKSRKQRAFLKKKSYEEGRYRDASSGRDLQFSNRLEWILKDKVLQALHLWQGCPSKNILISCGTWSCCRQRDLGFGGF